MAKYKMQCVHNLPESGTSNDIINLLMEVNLCTRCVTVETRGFGSNPLIGNIY